MCGCVRRQTADRLRELTLGADPASAPGLIPGDRDVDEPLVEVPLRRLGRAPRELELLVRLEVAAGADQLHSALEFA